VSVCAGTLQGRLGSLGLLWLGTTSHAMAVLRTVAFKSYTHIASHFEAFVHAEICRILINICGRESLGIVCLLYLLHGSVTCCVAPLMAMRCRPVHLGSPWYLYCCDVLDVDGVHGCRVCSRLDRLRRFHLACTDRVES
jgi:hypothetical protein